LTGVGGPGAEDGIPAGTVHLAVAGPETVTTHELQLSGSPTEVCRAATQAALTALERALTDAPVPATA
jgi:nicotinamide-nucleotide amidase